MRLSLRRTCIIMVATLAVMALCPLQGLSQSIWSRDTHIDRTPTVGTEVLVPSLDLLEPEFPALALYLYGHFPVAERFNINVDLPVSHYAIDGGDAGTAIGNPYIGIEYEMQGGHTIFDFGGRIPLADEMSGALTSGLLVEQYQAAPFITDVGALLANVHFSTANRSGWVLRGGGGTELAFPENGGGEMFVKYYGQLLYDIDPLAVGGGLSGNVLATQGNMSYAERSVHMAGLTGRYKLQGASVGAHIKLPLDDDLGEILRYVIGLSLSVHL